MSGFNWRRARAIAKKEVAHILRDKFTLALSLALPLVIVAIFGIAIEFNLNDIPTAYLDFDRSPSSRQMIETFGSSEYFHMRPVSSPLQGFKAIEAEEVNDFLVIPPNFEKDLLSGRGAKAQLLIDAAEGTAAGSILNYLSSIQMHTVEKITGRRIEPSVQLKSRFLFNPELNSKWFTVPGLTVIIMTMIAILLTALTVAREWESGSMELLLSTPVSPLEIIIGKLTPYAGLCLGSVAMVYVLARVGFGIPFKGSHFVYLLGCIIFLMTYLAQGLMISVLTRKQMLAMQFSMISGFIPSQLLSGFIFPIENMPAFFRYFTMILPARWFTTISRDSYLQGSSLWELRRPFFALILISALFIFISVKRFKRDVEP